VADAIDRAPRQLFGGGTSISGAIDHAMTLFPRTTLQGARRVIDVSGDGANNRGRPATGARDDAVRAGVGINGLPILAIEPDLEQYYLHNVIGGPGAFVVAAESYETFADAILEAVVEIAGTGDCAFVAINGPAGLAAKVEKAATPATEKSGPPAAVTTLGDPFSMRWAQGPQDGGDRRRRPRNAPELRPPCAHLLSSSRPARPGAADRVTAASRMTPSATDHLSNWQPAIARPRPAGGRRQTVSAGSDPRAAAVATPGSGRRQRCRRLAGPRPRCHTSSRIRAASYDLPNVGHDLEHTGATA
jgi:hypothetical protein